MTAQLHDERGRVIDYLRISVTDRCNLRCIYCMPEQGVPALEHADILRYEEIVRLARIAVDMGVKAIRITGGEPLVRKDVVNLVRMLSSIEGLDDLGMTTNGTLLAPVAASLRQAGLDRVNVSLDSLQPERYRRITRRGSLAEVLTGIAAARMAGLKPVKINMVMMRGVNDDEIVDMASRTRSHGWHVRLIEQMPLGHNAERAWGGYLSNREVRARIEAALGPLGPASLLAHGPARTFRLPDAEGTIGFISAISQHFCQNCNRLRLTADGKLLPCLLSDVEIDVRTALREGADADRLRALIRKAVAAKPQGHDLDEHHTTSHEMSRIGG